MLSLMLHMSYHCQSVHVELTQPVKIVFYVYRAFLCRRKCLLSSLERWRKSFRGLVLGNLTRLMKESWMELVLTKLTQFPKYFYYFAVLIKLLFVNKENHFWVSFYQVGSANEGFSYFVVLSSIDLSIHSSRLRWWILIILSCIWADLTKWKL